MTSPKNNLLPALSGFAHITRYWDNYQSQYSAKILPGQYYVTKNNECIVTVLGSCISACIRDKNNRVGGMNHFMLPLSDEKYPDIDIRLSKAARYGNYAMELLINDIIKNGGTKKNLEVKLFGGGKIINNMTDIGEKNINFANEYVRLESLPLINSDLGDIYPRKVYYYPRTGKVYVKKLKSLHNETIFEREKAYMKDITHKDVSGDIELF